MSHSPRLRQAIEGVEQRVNPLVWRTRSTLADPNSQTGRTNSFTVRVPRRFEIQHDKSLASLRTCIKSGRFA